MYSCNNVDLTLSNAANTDAVKIHKILKNVSFNIERGMRVGLIGKNGSGKTMLLKLLSGRILPTSGHVIYPENLRAIFSSSFGMDKRISGFDNIYLQCLAMGMGLKQIRSRVEEIVEFSMLGDDIFKPLSTYSAGMKLRLSVAISLTDVREHLIIDEWFGAGDKYFAKKLELRLNSIIQQTGTLITSSHNMNLLKRICDTGIYLSEGRMIHMGPINETIDMYNGDIK